MVETPRRLALRSQSALRQLTGMGCVSRHPAAKTLFCILSYKHRIINCKPGLSGCCPQKLTPFPSGLPALICKIFTKQHFRIYGKSQLTEKTRVL
jgi:hypothetical protein